MIGSKLPTKIKKLQGTHRPSRDVDNEMEVPETEALDVPSFLGEIAQKEWLKQTGVLSSLGMLAEVDEAALIAYCFYVGKWAKLEEQIEDEGYMVEGRKGEMVKHPLHQVASDARKAFTSLAREFGFTPLARTRISAPIKKPKDDFKDMI